MEQIEINKANHELEKAKYELDKMPKMIEIRNNIDAKILRILNLHKKHNELVDESNKNLSEDDRSRLTREVDRMWGYEFPPIMNDIIQLELMLSKLENREPRKFDLPLNPPYNIKLVIK